MMKVKGAEAAFQANAQRTDQAMREARPYKTAMGEPGKFYTEKVFVGGQSRNRANFGSFTKSASAVKVYKDHLQGENLSIGSSQAAMVNVKAPERLAKVELAQLIKHRLKKTNYDQCSTTASVFFNQQARMSKSFSKLVKKSIISSFYFCI